MITPDHPAEATTPPFPNPQSSDQSKQNLIYYRKRAGYSQRTASQSLGVTQAYYWTLEALHSESEKAIDLPWRWLQAIARLYDCPPDQIDPLCAENQGAPKYRAIVAGKKVVRCIEHPVTADDYSNNFRYFLAMSNLSIRDLADISGLSESSISKWCNGGVKYRGNNIFRAIEAMGAIEHRDLIVFPGAQKGRGGPVTLNDGTQIRLRIPAITVQDLKNNLRYHLAENGQRPFNLDNLLHLAPGTTRKWLDPNLSYFMSANQAKVVAAIYKFSIADISTDVLAARFGESAVNIETVPSVSGRADTDLLDMPVGIYASGGPAIDYPAAQAEETVATYLNFHASRSALRTVTVIGDSMFDFDSGTGYRSGMLALVDTSVTDPAMAVNRVVCWRSADNEIMIKRLIRIQGKLHFSSDNPHFIPKQYPVPENAVLLGVVIGGMFKD